MGIMETEIDIVHLTITDQITIDITVMDQVMEILDQDTTVMDQVMEIMDQDTTVMAHIEVIEA